MKPVRLGPRIVGKLDEAARIFHTTRDADRHFCIKYNGYGISRDVIAHLKSKDITMVYLEVRSARQFNGVYHVPLRTWVNHGKVDRLTEHDGWQIFLPWKEIVRHKGGEQQPIIEDKQQRLF